MARSGGSSRSVEIVDRGFAAGTTGPVPLRIEDLRLSGRFRTALSMDHARALAEFDGEYPPILVTRERTVVDGLHRVQAAKHQGRREMCCEIFDGSDTDAFVEFVRRNVVHGLPLTLAERRTAARRILHEKPDWSDRRIGEVTALSPGVVGRLRQAAPAATSGRRVGRDGRSRPEDARAARAQICEELAADPHASLRQIAARVGASPQTVRKVRLQQVNGRSQNGSTEPARSIAVVPPVQLLEQRARASTAALLSATALTSTAEGRAFAELLSSTNVERGALFAHLGSVPLSKVYEVADEARRRASCWADFAQALEGRPSLRARAVR
jgi:hypothetical protein